MLTETGAGVSLDEVAATGALVCGAAVAAGAAVEAVASPSNTKTKEPCLTLSPNFTLSSFTTPACEQGISMEALSDSTVIKLCSALTTSPGFTSSSMTVTSSKSPMSGTLISISAIVFQSVGDRAMLRIGLSRKLLKEYTTEVAKNLTQVRIEACGGSAIDHAVIPG